MENYRLVSRLCPETGRKQYGYLYDVYSFRTLLGFKPKTKLGSMCRILGKDRTVFICRDKEPSDGSYFNWWHSKADVENALEKHLDSLKRSSHYDERQEERKKDSEAYGIIVERRF